MEIVAVGPAGALRDLLRDRIDRVWGGVVARRGALVDPRDLPAYVACVDREPVGAVTYALGNTACEIVTLESVRRREGVARALLGAVAETARAADARELWLITTDDNVPAIACYEAFGFELARRYLGAVDDARRLLKPTIPELGVGGVPIRDELEYRLTL